MFFILEDILLKHYINLYYKKCTNSSFIYLTWKLKKSTEVFQKGKHTATKIFIAKRWIKDEVLRDKDYTHKTRATVLINQWKINGSWAPLKNVVSTSKRGDNSLFCLSQKKKKIISHTCHATMQHCESASLFVNCRWIMLTKIFIES